jgi:hypothetical protein
MKKVIYPRVDGKQWDTLRKKEFDKWRAQFEWTIESSLPKVTVLSKQEIRTIAWNCAFNVVTTGSDLV